MYYEAKLVYVIWLWYPASKGAVKLYTHTVQPLLGAHEAALDQQLAELSDLLLDSFSAYFAKCAMTCYPASPCRLRRSTFPLRPALCTLTQLFRGHRAVYGVPTGVVELVAGSAECFSLIANVALRLDHHWRHSAGKRVC